MTELLFIGAAALAGCLCACYLALGGQALYRRYRSNFQTHARQRLQEFYLFVDPTQLWALNLVFACFMAAVLLMISGSMWLSAISFGPLLCAPYLLLRAMRLRRLRIMDAQLPEFLMALAAAIQAGSGLQQALRHIALQTPAPLGQELGLLLRESRMGVPFDQALVSLAYRVPAEGMSLWVSSLRIASQTGGNLGPLLQEIASTLRARLILYGKIDALTSQGRLQAWIMACLPWLLAVVISALDPESMALFWHAPLGWGVLAGIVVLDAVGLWLIRRIVDIKV